MQNRPNFDTESQNIATQVKRGLLRAVYARGLVTQGQLDRLMELQRGR